MQQANGNILKQPSAVSAIPLTVGSVAPFDDTANKVKKQRSPAALLARIYPFMLTAKYSSVTDLCLIGNCTESDLDHLVELYSSVIEIIWFESEQE